MQKVPAITEADILADVILPNRSEMKPENVRYLLGLKFSTAATKQIRRLLQKNNRGTITAEERITLEKYVRAGQLLDLLQASARLSLEEVGANR